MINTCQHVVNCVLTVFSLCFCSTVLMDAQQVQRPWAKGNSSSIPVWIWSISANYFKISGHEWLTRRETSRYEDLNDQMCKKRDRCKPTECGCFLQHVKAPPFSAAWPQILRVWRMRSGGTLLPPLRWSLSEEQLQPWPRTVSTAVCSPCGRLWSSVLPCRCRGWMLLSGSASACVLGLADWKRQDV